MAVLGYYGNLLSIGDGYVWSQEEQIQKHEYYGKIEASGPCGPYAVVCTLDFPGLAPGTPAG